MRSCIICKKKVNRGAGPFFSAPKDAERRQKWSNICQMELTPSSRLCINHFPPSGIITAGSRFVLMPNTEPIVQQKQNEEFAKVVNSVETTTYEARNMIIDQSFQQNALDADLSNSINLDNMWLPVPTETDPLNIRSYKDQQTQTVDSHLKTPIAPLSELKEKMRQLETEKKELKCKLSQANLAIDAMRKIFTEGQIRKLMSPSYVHWSWEDITNAIYLHECGPNAYNHLYDRGFPLPHSNTLQRWCRKIDKQTADMPLGEGTSALSFDQSREEQISECDSSDDDDANTSTAG